MSKNNWLVLVVVGLALVGLFLLFKPPTSNIPTPTFTPESTLSASQSSSFASPTNMRSFDLTIQGKKLVAGPDTLKVTAGDQVTINITSDEDGEFHLHGYDISVDLEASKAAQLKFNADKTGRFPFELEKSKVELGALEVNPKP